MTTRLPETLPTRERIAKGDLEVVTDDNGLIRHASVRDTSVLAELIRRRHLDDLHAYYGAVFLDMKRAFLKPTFSYSNSLYASEFLGGDMSNGVFQTLYVRVCRKLPPRAEGLIVYALEQHVDPAAPLDRLLWQMFFQKPGKTPPIAPEDYRTAFESLIRAVDYVRKHTCSLCGTYENGCIHG